MVDEGKDEALKCMISARWRQEWHPAHNTLNQNTLLNRETEKA